MKMVKARVYKYVKEFVGEPKRSDLKIVEEELPPLKNGEFLAEAVYLSIDPCMRISSKVLGDTMIGSQVAQITESKNPKFKVGQFILAYFGWRTHTISNGVDIPKSYIIPKMDKLPPSLALGVLGLPGNAAYYGLLEICRPKPGETVVVSAAAGAVGSLVGQIARLNGCKVIGITSTDSKAAWLVKEMRFHHALNYKHPDFRTELSEIAPEGIDCYFDNVGGEISAIVIEQMNKYGRIASCGAISQYNNNIKRTKFDQLIFTTKELKMEGFVAMRWREKWMEGIAQMAKWVMKGDIKFHETITDGFDRMFEAFVDMLSGGNRGKAIVKV